MRYNLAQLNSRRSFNNNKKKIFSDIFVVLVLSKSDCMPIAIQVIQELK